MTVFYSDLEDTFTQGETLEEASYNASEVLSAMLAYRLEHNQEIPDPSAATQNSYMVAPGPEVTAIKFKALKTGVQRL
jgi:antitoxin HicB